MSGTATEESASNGLVDLHLDGAFNGGLRGELKLVLEGFPLGDDGVNMTASGVSFAAAGTSVFQGRIVGLNGDQVTARVSDASGRTLLLSLVVRLSQSLSALTGTLHGSTL